MENWRGGGVAGHGTWVGLAAVCLPGCYAEVYAGGGATTRPAAAVAPSYELGIQGGVYFDHPELFAAGVGVGTQGRALDGGEDGDIDMIIEQYGSGFVDIPLSEADWDELADDGQLRVTVAGHYAEVNGRRFVPAGETQAADGSAWSVFVGAAYAIGLESIVVGTLALGPRYAGSRQDIGVTHSFGVQARMRFGLNLVAPQIDANWESYTMPKSETTTDSTPGYTPEQTPEKRPTGGCYYRTVPGSNPPRQEHYCP